MIESGEDGIPCRVTANGNLENALMISGNFSPFPFLGQFHIYIQITKNVSCINKIAFDIFRLIATINNKFTVLIDIVASKLLEFRRPMPIRITHSSPAVYDIELGAVVCPLKNMNLI